MIRATRNEMDYNFINTRISREIHFVVHSEDNEESEI